MKYLFFVIFYFSTLLLYCQDETDWKKHSLVISPELLFGKTLRANYGFPKTNFQKQVVFGIGRDHTYNPQEWAHRLKGPKTWVSLGITDFGNIDRLGLAFTAMPIIEFNAFRSEKIKISGGSGISYFTQKYHPEANPDNRAVTTDFSWAVRMNFIYEILATENIDWRVGLGYSHHSNGHTKLMNNGYNSILISLSAAINPLPLNGQQEKAIFKHENTIYDYFEVRSGLGQNAFAIAFNNRKEVYSFSGEYGRVYNNTFKVGIGLYYRFYEHYYNYIRNNGSLTQTGREFDHYQNNPWHYATNLGLSLNGEVFLNHVGIDLQMGYNIFKPSYKIDWRINKGWTDTPQDIPEYWELGEFNTKFKLKYRISSRIGLKYYFMGMESKPVNNFYIGAHVNANLSQADFTELSFGYVHSFNYRKLN